MDFAHLNLERPSWGHGKGTRLPDTVAEVASTTGPWQPQYYFRRPWRCTPVLHTGEDRNFGYEHYADGPGAAALSMQATDLLSFSTVATDKPPPPWWLLKRTRREGGQSTVLSPFFLTEVTDVHSHLLPHWFDEPLTEGVEWRVKTPWLLFDREPSAEDSPVELKADWPTGTCGKDELEVEQCQEGQE
jgi:hypothetical protein